MRTIYLQSPVTSDEFAALVQEFPQYKITSECEKASDWSEVEIFYGNSLSKDELLAADRLKWIHCTSSEMGDLNLEETPNEREILITLSKGHSVAQMAEFVIGGILAFAKLFFQLPKASEERDEASIQEKVWSLQDKLLLQVGLGEVGTAVVKMANSLGMKSWGVRHEKSFHPFCHKTFSLSNLHSILPVADVVAIAISKRQMRDFIFRKAEFDLMKPDSILIVVGSEDAFCVDDLAESAQTGKFRGILIDSSSSYYSSPLQGIPNCVLTPSLAPYPLSKEHVAFRLFRRNLRLYIPGKIQEMKNLVLA